MKRIKIILVMSFLCVLLLCLLTACSNNSEPGNELDNKNNSEIKGDLSFTLLSNDTYAVNAANKNISGGLVIPSTYNGKK